MSFIQGLHGSVAAVLICVLLFVDEAGLPLPVAPNEGLLLLIGVHVASDAFPIWIIFPLAFLAMALGMFAGYGWARTVGQSGLQTLARHVRATDVYDRAQSRLKSAGPLGIGTARLLPGIRPYATLISGAAEVDIRTFLLGALPALLLWEIVWILVGILVGLPVAHFLGRFEKIALRGGILIALGVVAWYAIRHAPADRGGGIGRVAPRLRASLALVVDAAIVASVVGGLFAIGRRVVQSTTNVWVELIVAAFLLIVLLVAARGIQTPGELIFETDYWRHSHPAPG